MDDDDIETFDDLFEPFGLQGDTRKPPQPQRRTARETVPVRSSDAPRGANQGRGGGLVACASCGSPNDPANRHCDKCGARLVRGQMPVAPQPMLRTTAGARALIVLATVVLAVAILALVFNVFGGGGDTVESTSTTGGTTLAVSPIIELEPIRVECTSELTSFPCEALTDGDPTTSWNATEGGVGVTITFFFAPAVQITEMQIENLDDQGRFLRNARMKGIEVTVDDLTQLTVFTLADSNDEPQRVDIRSLHTSSLIIRITSAYPGQSYEGQEAFPELAAQDITFYGRPTPGE
ncbi:MAG TPA: zinc ribbon domain-containing protein [Acidimicrobiia bacterium]|jgi:hypothetical protein